MSFIKEFEDTKGAIRIHKSTDNTMTKRKRTKGQKDKQRSTKPTHKTKDRVLLINIDLLL
jgi:hypothetical protein